MLSLSKWTDEIHLKIWWSVGLEVIVGIFISFIFRILVVFLVRLLLGGFSLQDLLLARRYFQIILEMIAEIQMRLIKFTSLRIFSTLAFLFLMFILYILKFIKKPANVILLSKIVVLGLRLSIPAELNMPFQSYAQAMAHDPQVEEGRPLRNSL